MKKIRKVLLTGLLACSLGFTVVACDGHTSPTTSEDAGANVSRITIASDFDPYQVVGTFINADEVLTFYGNGNTELTNVDYTLNPTANANAVEIDGHTIIVKSETDSEVRIQVTAGTRSAYLTFTPVSQAKKNMLTMAETMGAHYTYYEIDQQGYTYPSILHDEDYFLYFTADYSDTGEVTDQYYYGYGQFSDAAYNVRANADFTEITAEPGAVTRSISDYGFGQATTLDFLSFTTVSETDPYGNTSSYLSSTDEAMLNSVVPAEFGIVAPQELVNRYKSLNYELEPGKGLNYEYVSGEMVVYPDAATLNIDNAQYPVHLIGVLATVKYTDTNEISTLGYGSYYLITDENYNADISVNTNEQMEAFIADENNVPEPLDSEVLVNAVDAAIEKPNYTVTASLGWEALDGNLDKLADLPDNQISNLWYDNGWAQFFNVPYGTYTAKVNESTIYNDYSIFTITRTYNEETNSYESTRNTTTGVSGFATHTDDTVYSFSGENASSLKFAKPSSADVYTTRARVEGLKAVHTEAGYDSYGSIEIMNLSSAKDYEGYTEYIGNGTLYTQILINMFNLYPYGDYTLGTSLGENPVLVSGETFLNMFNYRIIVRDSGEIELMAYLLWSNIESGEYMGNYAGLVLRVNITDLGTTEVPSVTVVPPAA